MVRLAAQHWATGQAGTEPREPRRFDGWLFFVVLPLGFAAWAVAIGMSPAQLLDSRGAMLYIGSQVLAAWWANSLACLSLARLAPGAFAARWRLLVAGFWLAWLPLTVFYHFHAAGFASIYPVLVNEAAPLPRLDATYLWELLRFSTPFLPLWLLAVYGYEFACGVRWFEPRVPAASGRPLAAGNDAAVPTRLPDPAGTGLLAAATSLPADAALIALKAEEHYVRIWTSAGRELVRYRFRDAVAELAPAAGGRVHRSWWISWAHVAGVRPRGRSLVVLLDNGLQVPVSLAHKAEVTARLKSRGL